MEKDFSVDMLIKSVLKKVSRRKLKNITKLKKIDIALAPHHFST